MCGPFCKEDTAFVIIRERRREMTLSPLYGIKVSVNVGGFSQMQSTCAWIKALYVVGNLRHTSFPSSCVSNMVIDVLYEALYLMYSV